LRTHREAGDIHKWTKFGYRLFLRLGNGLKRLVRRLEIVRAISEVHGDANGEALGYAAEFEMAGELHETGQGGACAKW
jgi:hypothetical protein